MSRAPDPHLPASTTDDLPAGLAPIRDGEFQQLAALIREETGIALGANKREMLASRLGKRLRALGYTAYGQYLDHLTARDADRSERRRMINCVTTNKTDFFREPHHFRFLRDRIVPEAAAGRPARGPARLRVWSAACSTGEEPYSIAMTLRDGCPGPTWDVRVLASDIDTDVLDRAAAGVYAADRVSQVPAALRAKSFVPDHESDQVTVRPELRDMVTFRRINLIDDSWPIRSTFDVIFCRNVIIYFDRPTQQRLLERFAALLRPNGYLLLGHSENLHWLSDLYAPLGDTVYQLKSGAGPSRPAPAPVRAESPSSPAAPRAVPAASPEPQPGVAPARPRQSPRPPARPPGGVTTMRPGAFRNLPTRSIIVGEVFAAREPVCVTTLLGSCVAACLFDPVARAGGMNHFLLPEGGADEEVSARYGVHAMELLINEVMKIGGERDRLVAKLFGGNRVMRDSLRASDVNEKNIRFATGFLQTEGIPVVGKCLGGTAGMQVRFLPHTGQAFIRSLAGRLTEDLATTERRFGEAVVRELSTPAQDSVTLF